MHRAAPGGRDAGVDGVPDKRVTKHHGTAWFLRRPVHQARGHRRFDRRAGRLNLRRLAQLGEGDAQVKNREHLEDGPGVRRQTCQTVADGGSQRPGQHLPARSPRIGAGFLTQDRPQVQRMPAGTPVQPLDGLLVQRFRPERGGQRCDLIRGQPVQRYLQPVLDAREHALSRLVQEVAGRAIDHDGEYRIDRQPPQHERQGLRRLPVDPLQIIDHDGQRPRDQLLSDHFEQPRAHGERRGGRAGLGRQYRLPGRPEQLIDNPEVQVGLGQAGPGLQHPQACGLGQAAPHQGCFTHPRIAFDGYQPRLSRLHPGDYLRQLAAFCRPADENVERCLPVLQATPPTLLVPSAYS